MPEESVCYNSLLKRLVSVLIIDEALADEKRSVACSDDAQPLRDVARLAREEKKKEAIERSRQRQADPLYFGRILEQNKRTEQVEVSSVEEDDAGTDEAVIESIGDPFRPSYASKGKNKIFVR